MFDYVILLVCCASDSTVFLLRCLKVVGSLASIVVTMMLCLSDAVVDIVVPCSFLWHSLSDCEFGTSWLSGRIVSTTSDASSRSDAAAATQIKQQSHKHWALAASSTQHAQTYDPLFVQAKLCSAYAARIASCGLEFDVIFGGVRIPRVLNHSSL